MRTMERKGLPFRLVVLSILIFGMMMFIVPSTMAADHSFELDGVETSMEWDLFETDHVEGRFSISNTGTLNDSYTVDIVDPPLSGKIDIVMEEYAGETVESGNQTYVTINITRSSTRTDVKAGNYTILINVSSDGNGSVYSNITLFLDVEQFFELNIKGVIAHDVTAGTPKNIGITIENRANGDDLVDVLIDDVIPSGAGDWLGLEYLDQGGPDNHTLYNVSIDWDKEVTVQLLVDLTEEEALEVFDADSDRKVHIYIQAISDDGTLLDQSEEVVCILDEIYRFEVSEPVESTLNLTDPTSNTPVKFKFNLTNTGIAEDRYSFLYSANEFLDIVFYDPGQVGNETVEIVVEVLVAETIRTNEDELWRLPSGEYDIVVTVKSKGDSTQREELNVIVVIGEKAYIELTNMETSDQKPVDPGDSVSYTLKLSNYGNTVDNITVSLTDPTFSVYGELIWNEGEADEKKGKEVNITLEPGESDLVTYNVTADREDIRDFGYTEFDETIVAVSSIEPDFIDQIYFSTQINEKHHAVDVSMPVTTVEVTPEEDKETAQLTTDIRNDGDDPDDIEIKIRTVSVNELNESQKVGKLAWVDLCWIDGDNISHNGTTILIEDMATGSSNNETIEVNFDVGTVPVDAEAGNYVYNLTAESQYGRPGDPGVLQYIHIILTIEEKNYRVTLNVPEIDAEVTPEEDEETAQLTTDIRNDGDDPDDIEIKIRTVSVNELNESQKVGKLAWVDLGWINGDNISHNGTTIMIEDMATGSSNNETIEVNFDVGTVPVDAEAGNYVYNLTAESQYGRPGDPGVLQYIHIILTIGEVAGFEMRPDLTDVTIDHSGQIADDKMTFLVTIENIGNFEDEFTIRTASAHSDIEIKYDSQTTRKIKIMPDEEQAVQMEISVDKNTRMGTYDVVLRVQSETGLSETETITVVVKAPDIQISKHDIKPMKSPDSVRPGQDLMFLVRVWNNGSGPALDVDVRFLIDAELMDNQTIDIQEGSYTDITFVWENVRSGTHSVRILTSNAPPTNPDQNVDISIKKDEEDKGVAMETALAVTAVAILALVVIGLLLVQRRKK